VVRHNYIGENEKVARPANFVERLASDELDCFGLKNWQAILGDGCNEERLRIP
jgi:hypothetical protein